MSSQPPATPPAANDNDAADTIAEHSFLQISGQIFYLDLYNLLKHFANHKFQSSFLK